MRILLLSLFTILFSGASFSQSTDVVYGQRFQLKSTFLKENRNYQVYLPESYHQNKEAKYPVLYMIDGDYNFHYMTGLVSHLSSMSEVIPELIIVGISDKGKHQYRKNCAPNNPDNPESISNGNASILMDFIGKELQPLIEKNYRVADYKILSGHSIGGLFVMSTFVEQTDLFDAYIAISPSMWWGDAFMNKKIGTFIKEKQEIEKSLFVSLGDEKGMRVFEMVDAIDAYGAPGLNFAFNYFPKETHGTVAIPSAKAALLEIFKNYTVTRKQFYEFKNAKEAVGHYVNLNKNFKMNIPIPLSSLGNMVYYYNRKNLTEELSSMESEIQKHIPSSLPAFKCALAVENEGAGKVEEAKKIYEQCMKDYPDYFEAHMNSAIIYRDAQNYKAAYLLMTKAVELAKAQQVPQWKMNELEGNLTKIKSMMK